MLIIVWKYTYVLLLCGFFFVTNMSVLPEEITLFIDEFVEKCSDSNEKTIKCLHCMVAFKLRGDKKVF